MQAHKNMVQAHWNPVRALWLLWHLMQIMTRWTPRCTFRQAQFKRLLIVIFLMYCTSQGETPGIASSRVTPNSSVSPHALFAGE